VPMLNHSSEYLAITNLFNHDKALINVYHSQMLQFSLRLKRIERHKCRYHLPR
jgi:hypothetical protein